MRTIYSTIMSSNREFREKTIRFYREVKKIIRREEQYGIPYSYLIKIDENLYESIDNDEFEDEIALAIQKKWDARKLERSLKKKEVNVNKKIQKI